MPPFTLTFHVLKLQLVDRAPGDENWERGFKSNWISPLNRVSCRLVRTVAGMTDPDSLPKHASSSSAATTTASASGSHNKHHHSHRAVGAPSSSSLAAAANQLQQSTKEGAAPSPPSPNTLPVSHREHNKHQASQILATTPPLVIDPRKLCAVFPHHHPSVATTSVSSSNTQQKKSEEEMMQTKQQQNQQQNYNTYTESLLVVPGMEDLLTDSPVILMDVCRHSTKYPSAVECRTTFNLVTMSGSIGDISSSGDAASIVDHALMAPVAPLTDTSIFVVATVALVKRPVVVANIHPASGSKLSVLQQQQAQTSSSTTTLTDPHSHVASSADESFVPQPPPTSLENLSGSIRLSTADLFIPSLIFHYPDPAAHLISNVLVVGNATENSQLCIKIQSSCDLIRAFPSAGTVVGPRQRAFFSVTFSGWKPQHLTTTTSSSSASSAASPLTKSSSYGSSGFISQLASARVEVTVQDVSSGEVHHSVPLRLHLRKADQGQPFGCAPSSTQGAHAPYHFWINSVCISNRSLHSIKDMPYVRSVLPVFLMRAPAEDVMAVAKEAIIAQSNTTTTTTTTATATSSAPTISNVAGEFSSPDTTTSSQEKNKNKNQQQPPNTATLISQPKSRIPIPIKQGTIDLQTSSCERFLISVTIGVVRGLPPTGSFGYHCPTYKIVACPMKENIIVSNSGENNNNTSAAGAAVAMTEFLRFETGEVYPSVNGSLRWDMPLVFRRTLKSNSNNKQQKQELITKKHRDPTTNNNNNNDKNSFEQENEKEEKEKQEKEQEKSQNSEPLWQHCRVGLRLIEVPPPAAGSNNSCNQQQNSDNNSFPLPMTMNTGNVIAEATITISPPSPLNAVPCVLPQCLVFVVRPCFPRYDALRTTSLIAKGTVVALSSV